MIFPPHESIEKLNVAMLKNTQVTEVTNISSTDRFDENTEERLVTEAFQPLAKQVLGFVQYEK